ncbi:pseudouridine synthase [Jiulongibacter sp. NS-SX5]|uniref:pseudouridine synthase n=1 Tax=Jiulongibacter sp. NS-SX5 TaxID=3463854 RepID=UPI0040587099
MSERSTYPEELHFFTEGISQIELPKKFTYPFSYQPHILSKAAANAVQEYLKTAYKGNHNFGLKEGQKGLIIGKMFGVLVVKTNDHKLGYLAAYSGKLDQGEQEPYFVPPVFDVFKQGGFYREEEKNISALNYAIETLENDENYNSLFQNFKALKAEYTEQLTSLKTEIKKSKKLRKERKKDALSKLSPPEQEEVFKQNARESYLQKQQLDTLISKWEEKIEQVQAELRPFQNKLESYKEERKQRSNALQQKLFDNYRFLNAEQKDKSLLDIFTKELQIAPPAGAGECAAPKLLQFAYHHKLEPVALAEFWWGASPKSEIKKHGFYYPACNTKCGPILGFMLQGLDVDENPMKHNSAEGKELEIVFDDQDIIVVNKPHEFLSVPGRYVKDSVQTRIREKFPEAFLVHRLDQSTSGLILIAKNHENYVNLQRQFTERTVSKRYVALLDREIKENEGFINLPLRVDLDNRPNQLVCYEHGKPAKTKYKVIERKKGKTRVHFFPITGRTHQLRVHASHIDGLNAPIIGDDLYGLKSERLCLHAESLTVTHPTTQKKISFFAEAKF